MFTILYFKLYGIGLNQNQLKKKEESAIQYIDSFAPMHINSSTIIMDMSCKTYRRVPVPKTLSLAGIEKRKQASYK
jgi:hypothetical protein